MYFNSIQRMLLYGFIGLSDTDKKRVLRLR